MRCEAGGPARRGPGPGKVLDRHRERLAIVYVRQSTPQQMERHQESTRLQYALVDRAVDFGWDRERVVLIDDDLGRSGGDDRRPLGLPAPRRPGRARQGWAGAGHRDVPPGALLSRLASTPGDLRVVRYPHRRC